MNRFVVLLILLIAFPVAAMAGGGEGGGNVIRSVGIAILAATVMAYIGYRFKQPLLLAYLAAGLIIGPNIGFGLIATIADIEAISHFGLILLLFLIGLEIDIKKLKSSGSSLLISGFTQFPISVVLGLGFFLILGYSFSDPGYDLIYLAGCLGLSSTAIVVKLLYSKFELDTLAGRLTLGILVFQDIWAIIMLGIQPNLANPDVISILLSFAKGGLLVTLSLLTSRYLLVSLFKSVAKVPELILVSSLAWCFVVCGAAALLDLSVEMGALIAGIAISTFPYNLDVIAKVVNIRDFFITLFFVSLGMQIPDPSGNPMVLVAAAGISLFLIASRFLAIFPVLYKMKNGLRVSLLTSINLAQLSEFSLVIAALGLAAGHISQDTLAVIIFVFVITSVVSTYLVNYSDPIQKWMASGLRRVGFREVESASAEDESTPGKDIALLGFHRTASSLLHEIIHRESSIASQLKEKLMVVDFNPEIHASLQSMGIKVVYGDISHADSLHHAGIHDVKIVISTIPDTLLVGTDNLKIIRQMKDLCPHAMIIVTAESTERALKMYAEGADYVLLPRLLAADKLMGIIQLKLSGSTESIESSIRQEIDSLTTRQEVIR
ncbi:MAG: cation:proton antiporter [Bacteroidetes bacterium]|nr:cation:proton antiporter [Bacteroidota bacterium]